MESYKYKKPQKLSGTIPFLTKGPMALFFGGKTEDDISQNTN